MKHTYYEQNIDKLQVALKNIRKSFELLPKSIKNRSQIDENTFLDRFRRQVAIRSAPRRSLRIGGLDIWRLFGRKWCPKGPAWIQNGSKIALASIGWHLDPPKMLSEWGFGKNLKSWWKFESKWFIRKYCWNFKFKKKYSRDDASSRANDWWHDIE